jgi:hypothetical protein
MPNTALRRVSDARDLTIILASIMRGISTSACPELLYRYFYF